MTNDTRWIACNDAIIRDIRHDNSARAHDRGSADANAAPHARTSSYPCIVTNGNRAIFQIDISGVAAEINSPEMAVARCCVPRVGKIVEYVDAMCDHHPAADLDVRAGPNPGSLTDVTPCANFDVAAVRKDEQFTAHDCMFADRDARAVARKIKNLR